MVVAPLLSIVIPTWNRARFLANTLEQLDRESDMIQDGMLEIIVSDNHSSDETKVVVERAQSIGMRIHYICNSENIGSDANIAQAFNEALGQYVLILGDDDLLVDGTLSWLMICLTTKEYGVVCLRPYGFERDFRKEYPGNSGSDKEFASSGEFLVAIGPLVTFISSCVINKHLLKHVNAHDYCGGNLVQVHLVVQAALLGHLNLYSSRYHVACTRNNSGGYDFFRVFVEELGKIFDQYQSIGLSRESIKAFEKRMIVGYFPYYLFRQLRSNVGDRKADRDRMEKRFGQSFLYRFWLAPALFLPRSLALLWAALTTLIGRAIHGDLRRGLYFLWNKSVLSVKVKLSKVIR